MNLISLFLAEFIDIYIWFQTYLAFACFLETIGVELYLAFLIHHFFSTLYRSISDRLKIVPLIVRNAPEGFREVHRLHWVSSFLLPGQFNKRFLFALCTLEIILRF